MLDKNPDFVAQYSSQDEALTALARYSLSHNSRYRMFTNVKVGSIPSDSIPSLTPSQIAHAKQSLVDSIATTEGNGRIAGINGMFATGKDFNQYQFSPEEVLAQQNGHKFLIKNLTTKLNEMKKAGTLTPDDETFITSLIEKSKSVIEYKTKGLEYYEKYTQLINNPTDSKLAEAVKLLEKELVTIQSKMNGQEIAEIIAQCPEYATKFPSISGIVTMMNDMNTIQDYK